MPIVEIVSSLVIIAGDLARNKFQHDGKGPGFLEHLGILDQQFGLFGRAALDAVAAHLIDRLRRQADMGDDRYLFARRAV